MSLTATVTSSTPADGTFSASGAAAWDAGMSGGITGFGTGVEAALGINTGSAGSVVLFNGALGTPSSGTATNLTGLPIAGLTGLGTGVGTALAVNVGSAGAFVTFNGALGTPSSGTLTNASGLPVSSGISGFGTGVATALAVNVGSSGAFVTNGGALGTPSSGTLTNATGLPISGVASLDGTPDTDHTSTGLKTSTFNAGESVTVMDLVYFKSDGKWWKTDADAAGTAGGMLAISLETKSADQAMSVALPGSFVRDDTWNWTVGAVLYIDTATAGGITATQPSGTDDVVRVVGWAVSADVIWFQPSSDYATVV